MERTMADGEVDPLRADRAKEPRGKGNVDLEREVAEYFQLNKPATSQLIGWDMDHGHPAFVVRVESGLFRVRVERLGN